jgi:hypothetical protein
VDAKLCICRGQDFTVLLAAWFKRTRGTIAQGVSNGKPTWTYDRLRTAVTLIRTLSEDKGQKALF